MPSPMFQRCALTLVSAACLLLSAQAQAKPFKWSSASDIPTLDIHSQNNALGNGVHAAIYDSLVYYNSKTFKVEPRLATSWKEVSPTQYRFTLRADVKFSDGSALTADDVVFSLERARAKTSNFHVYTQGFSRIAKVDARTVDIILSGPNPVLLNQLTELRIMSKAWAEKNKSVDPKDIKTKEEYFAHRNANGTGPFMLKSWEQDVRLTLVRNPNWWGKLEGNVTEIVYSPIKAEATRIAALLSGEVDLVLEYNGDIAQAMVEDSDIGFVIPKEGSQLNSDNLCIPKGAPHPKNAHAFINYLLDAEAGKKITETILYPTPNDAAKALMPDAYKNNPVIFPPADVLAKCEYAKFNSELQPKYEEAFTRVRAA